MMSKEDISEFKRAHHVLEKRIEEIDRNQISAIVKLSEELKEIIDDIETVLERDKSLWNPDISTKIKLAKRGVKVGKRLKYFEDDIVKEFDKGNLSKENGRKFSSVTKQIKANKLPLAKKEFENLWKIVELSKNYGISKDEFERKGDMLKKEKLRVKNLLAEMSRLERQTFDSEKVRKYEELLKNLGNLEKIRAAYLFSLTSEPITELLEDADGLRDHLPRFPGKEDMGEILDFFSEYPAIGKYKVSQICEMFNFSEKRISHICPETSRFKRIILTNKNLFETLHGLERTNFLTVDDGNEKVLDFFAEKIEGAASVVEQIRMLRKEKLSCKDEYERKKEVEERTKELSKYSKDNLEKELEEIESLLEFLHSGPEEREEKKGLLSKLSSFFKTGKSV
jgi:hypothetical protein